MRQRASLVLILGLVLCGLAIGTPRTGRVPRPAAITGMEDVHLAPGVVSHGGRQTLDDDTITGSRYLMGTTWTDLQQNGTAGKQIAVDGDGWVHNTWTNGLNNGSTQRHVYYNVWDPGSQSFAIENGQQANTGTRGGFTGMAVLPNGFGLPVFHQIFGGTTPHSAGAIDFAARQGAFTPCEVPHRPADAQIIWPHADVDINGNLHAVHTESGGSSQNFYSRGVPYFSEDGFGDSISWPDGFMQVPDPAYFVTIDVAAAHHSPRIAMAWLWDDTTANPWIGMNVFYKTSEDGGLNWGETHNVTNFAPVDTNCVHDGGTVASCNRDTLKPWLDLSVIFDQNDNVHIAFTTWGLFDFVENAADSTVHGPYYYIAKPSMIWHWDEFHNMFSLVAERWYGADDPSAHPLGQNNTMCQRPNLAVDTTTGYLYCSYQMYDTSQWSEDGYLMSDAYITVSTSGGLFWAEGTDVTKTDGGQNTPPPGSKSERDITIAKSVTGGYVHMQYELDHDAGTAVWATNPEGVPTLNEEYYLRIPVDSIPTAPLMRVAALRYDSTGFPNAVDDHRNLKPGQFALYQNYPNPFNPNTNIQFDLAAETKVSLKVFDVLGRQVATLLDNAPLSAGAHFMSFDGSNLSSGVYFYRLETPTMNQTKKMVLMK